MCHFVLRLTIGQMGRLGVIAPVTTISSVWSDIPASSRWPSFKGQISNAHHQDTRMSDVSLIITFRGKGLLDRAIR